MANDVADLLLRIDATTENLRRELKKADAAVTGSTQAIDKNTRAIDKSFNKMSQGATQALDRVKTALIGMAVAFATREIVQYADAWQNATNQLKTVQKETESLSATQSKLMAISNESRQGFESTANLYTRLTRSTQSMNLSQEETIALTNTINKSFAVSGASATEASNAIIQLSQGLAAGALRGEEFNSVSEQSPILMQAIADNLKMTRGELRDFAADGGITAEIVVQSLQKASGQIDETFSKMSATFEQNMTVAKNNMLEFVGSSDVVKSTTATLGTAMVSLSENIEYVGYAAQAAAALIVARFVPTVGAALTSMAGATTAAGLLGGALKLLGGPVGVAILASIGMYKLVDAYLDHNDVAKQAETAAFLLGEGIELAGDEFENIIEKIDRASESLRTYIASGGALSVMSSQWLKDQAARIAAMNEESEGSEDLNEKTLKQIDALKNQQLALVMTDRAQAIFNETLKALANGTAPKAIAKIATLAAENYDLEQSQKDAKTSLDLWNESISDYLKEQKKATEEAEKNASAIYDQIGQLKQEQIALGMSSRAQAIFNATMDAANSGALPEQIAKIAELTAKNYDLAVANTATGKAAEDAAKRTEENWGRTHEFLTNTLMDFGERGGNVWEELGDTAVKTIKRIASEWLASGIMGFMSGGGLGGFSIGGGAGGGILGGLGGLLGGASKGAAAGGIGGALSSAGSSALAALQAVPGWGWALGGAAAIAGLAKKETPSANAGMLLRPVGDGDRQFDVPAFASGFDPVGFARREDQAAATQVIDVFRADDAILSALAKASGIDVQYSANQFGGFDEKGQGSGLFLGSASEDGKNTGAPLGQQRDKFVSDWLRGLSGKVDQSLIQDALSAGSADAMIARAAQLAGVDGSHANGLSRVPFDGYRAELHRNEEVLTANDPRNSNNSMASRGDQLMMQMAIGIKRMSDLIDDWNATGLPPERAVLA